MVKYVVDADTIDNARLMGPSTPLMLFVVEIQTREVYYICLSDYYDKILEPRGFNFSQKSITINIPKSNRLSDQHAHEVMRFFATRAKLYAMFNLAQFQFRETRYLLDAFTSHEHIDALAENYQIIERFARDADMGSAYHLAAYARLSSQARQDNFRDRGRRACQD